MCFLGALWVCRRIESHFILHGTLVGVVAALIYIALTRAQPEPLAYLVAHALQLVGGACGGFVAQRRRAPSPPQPSQDWFIASPRTVCENSHSALHVVLW